jgi:glycosyltransferase involved in cell wall biosynthesis
MKVGMLLNKMLPQTGGGFTFVDEILKALVEFGEESGHTFILFCDKAQEMNISAKHIHYIPIQLPGKTTKQKVVEYIKGKIYNLLYHQPIVTSEIDKFVINSGVEMMVYLMPTLHHTVDIPYITTVWDLQHRLQPFFPEVSSSGEWKSREILYATNLRRASMVIVGTEAGKAEVERFYQVPAERIKKIPHPTPQFARGAFIDHDGAQVLSKYNIPEGYLFYPAQFWPHKNHAGLLSAVRVLRDKYDLVLPVVFVGADYGNLPYIKRLTADLGLSDQVHFLGFVDREEIISLYRNAFALVYVTFFGPENLPPLEAFALGCPVIASHVSGSDEQLGDAALLVDPKDEHQIASAIKSLHDDDNLRLALIQRGREKASQFTAKDFAESLFSIFDDFTRIRRCWSNKGYSPK